MTQAWKASLTVTVITFLVGLVAHQTGTAYAASEHLAEVDGQVITSEEVEKALGAPLAKLHEQIYTMKRQKLESLIGERLLAQEAARRGVSVPALLDAEVTSKVGLVSEQEADAYYQGHKGELSGDEAEAREQARSKLQSQKIATQRLAFVQSLREKAKIKITLKAPPVVRMDVRQDVGIGRGPATAPVTIIEFTDFQCPFCKRVQPTVKQLLDRYGNKLRHIHRDFPIARIHPEARQAHQAARCALDQGKFWAYHDKLFDGGAKGGLEGFKMYAKDIGLDTTQFEQCLSRASHDAEIQGDIEEGTRLGVNGTPTFFINGRQLIGAQPLEKFVEVIDDELSRVQ